MICLELHTIIFTFTLILTLRLSDVQTSSVGSEGMTDIRSAIDNHRSRLARTSDHYADDSQSMSRPGHRKNTGPLSPIQKQEIFTAIKAQILQHLNMSEIPKPPVGGYPNPGVFLTAMNLHTSNSDGSEDSVTPKYEDTFENENVVDNTDNSRKLNIDSPVVPSPEVRGSREAREGRIETSFHDKRDQLRATGRKKRHRTRRIISFAENVSNLTDKRAVEFKVVDSDKQNSYRRRENDADLLVTGATVMFFIKQKDDLPNSDQLFMLDHTSRTRRKKSAKKFPPKRINIRVYTLTDKSETDLMTGKSQMMDDRFPTGEERVARENRVPAAEDEVPAGDDGVPLGAKLITERYVVTRKRVGWEKLLLPTTVVQRAVDSDNHLLRLLIVCNECVSEARDDSQLSHDESHLSHAESQLSHDESHLSHEGSREDTEGVSYDAEEPHDVTIDQLITDNQSLSHSNLSPKRIRSVQTPSRLSHTKRREFKAKKSSQSDTSSRKSKKDLIAEHGNRPYLVVHAKKKMNRLKRHNFT